MAYAAVASLLQTLEYLLQFPCIILEAKMMQAKTFCKEVYLVLWCFKPFLNFSKARLKKIKEEVEPLGLFIEEFSAFDAYQFEFPDLGVYSGGSAHRRLKKKIETPLLNLREKIKPLSLPIAEYVKAVKFVDYEVVRGILEITERIFGNNHGIPILSEKTFDISEQVSQISEELEFIAKTLETFEMNPLKSFWEVAFGILLESQNLLQEIAFFHEVILQTKFFCENLQFFLSFFEDYSGKFSDPQLVRSLKIVAYKAGNFVEECMMDNPMESEMKYFLDAVTKSAVYPSRKEINLEKVVKDIFYGKKGIRQYLFQALDEIHQLMGEIGKIHDNLSSLQAASNSSSEGSSLRNSKQDIVVGLDGEMIRIMEGLTRLPSGLEIVTIVGMGGIGKTTLARQIFHHPFIDYHFHCRAWVRISQVHSVSKLLLSLVGSVGQPTNEMLEKCNAQLAEQLYRSLQGKRYLIILDDVWSISAWNDIKRCFPDDKIGSRIIVTSRFTELAIHTNPRNPPHCMNLLDPGQSWELLEKLAFGQEVCPPSWQILARK